MSNRAKMIFLGLCVIGSFLIYCVYYYSNMIKNAPFRFSDFDSIEITYGTPQEMLNSYNTKTQVYKYLTKEDSLIETSLKMRDDDLLYLHRKAQELGFWNVDDDMTTSRKNPTEGNDVPRYILQFTYKDKSKKVTLDADYPGNPKMKGAAKSVVDAVLTMIADVQSR